MKLSSPHYLPLSLPYFSVLAFILVLVIAVIELRVLRYAYLRIGLRSRAALLLLLASLAGSYFNIPVAELPAHQVLERQEVAFFEVRYAIPVAVEWPGTLIAVNIGGAVIPVLVSLYLLITHHLWVRGTVAVFCVTYLCNALVSPVPGLGIALPTFVPPITAEAVALLLSRSETAPLAYVGGSLGALAGADLLNLNNAGSPRASTRRI
jgi:uncharacterized membrane protein